MCINIDYYTYSITITLRSTQRHLHELIILSGAYTQVSVNNSRFAYSLTAHILFAVLITEGAINFKPSPCCWRIQASDRGSVIIFVRASGKGTCYNAQTDVELLDTETEINLGIDKLNFTHTHTRTAFASFFAPSLSLIVLSHQHPLQFFSFLLFSLSAQLRAGLLILQHVLNVLAHLLKITVLCWAAVRVRR